MGSSVSTLNLIAVLVSLFGQYGPKLIAGVIDLIKGNPQAPGETDDAYVARLNTLSDAKLADAAANDAKVEAS